jgi:hypothetical protein
MARYTCSFTVAVGVERLRQLLVEILHSCNLDIMHDTSDYMMARERPGQISFSKLATVEVLIDKTTATETSTRMDLVIKNEELPLQLDNHCRQIFDLVKQSIKENRNWQMVENLAG